MSPAGRISRRVDFSCLIQTGLQYLQSFRIATILYPRSGSISLLSVYFQGSIEIRDALPGSNELIEIQIEKFGATEAIARDVMYVNQTMFDIGRGRVFVLQLVSLAISARCAAIDANYMVDTSSIGHVLKNIP